MTLEGVIFDMDGLLVNTEPFWVKAEILGFADVGLHLNDEDCKKTMGYKVDEVVDFWFSQNPWKGFSNSEVVEKILSHLQEMIDKEGEAMEGVEYILNYFKNKGIKIGLASSSHLRVIHQVVEKLKIKDFFHVLHSAENEDFGKPHPAVYLNAAFKMGVNPLKTLAFEDSFNGLLSAKSARMKTVSIPDSLVWDDSHFNIADLKLRSLKEFDENAFDRIIQSL